MESTDDHLISPYSTASFAGSFTATSSDPQPAPAFHRYQHGDLVAPWYATSSPEQHAHSGNVRASPIPQSYQVLGPYMIAEPAMHGQSVAYDPAVVSNQQIQAQFSPGMVDHRTTPPSPPNNGVPGVYYQNAPATSYLAQHTVPVTVPMAYSPSGTMGHPGDYTATSEGHRALYKNSSTASLDPVTGKSYPSASNQSGQQTYTFVTSETSSFTSDTGAGSQQRPQKAPKKRGSVPATRRPRKPPLEVVVEPRLQTAPEIARNAPRTASPKRARTDVSQPEPSAKGETAPDSVQSVSPGTISKAHIGQRSRASTDVSQRQNPASHVDGQRVEHSDGSRQTQSNNSEYLRQQLHGALVENRTLRAFKMRQDEIEKQVAELRKDFRRHERDMKCKALEIASMSAGNAMGDEPPRGEAG
jgi:hypothetical protein